MSPSLTVGGRGGRAGPKTSFVGRMSRVCARPSVASVFKGADMNACGLIFPSLVASAFKTSV